jgi:hypothetical protein
MSEMSSELVRRQGRLSVFLSYFTGMRNGAPLFLTKNTTNFASGCGGRTTQLTRPGPTSRPRSSAAPSSALAQHAISTPRRPVPNETRRRRPPRGRRMGTAGDRPPAPHRSPPAPAKDRPGRGPPPRGRRELDATFLQPLLGTGQAESFFRLPFACVRAAIYVQDFTCGECGLS